MLQGPPCCGGYGLRLPPILPVAHTGKLGGLEEQGWWAGDRGGRASLWRRPLVRTKRAPNPPCSRQDQKTLVRAVFVLTLACVV